MVQTVISGKSDRRVQEETTTDQSSISNQSEDGKQKDGVEFKDDSD